MKLSEQVYFYKGDSGNLEKSFSHLYRGIGSSNFLVVKDGEQLMIDSGFLDGPHRKRVASELLADGIDINATGTVIFSHSHPDHIQSASRFARSLGMRFAMHHDSELFVRSERFHFEAYYNYPDSVRREIMILPEFLVKLAFKLLGFGFRAMQIHYFFHHSSVFRFCGGIHVVSLPGHCLGHAGFHIPSHRLFYAADLVFDSKSRFGLMPCLNNALSSLPRALDDLERVKALDIEVFVPGHGELILGREAIHQFLDTARENIDRLIAEILLHVVNSFGLTLTQVFRCLFGRVGLGLYVHLAPLVYQTLHHLAAIGRISCGNRGRIIVWMSNRADSNRTVAWPEPVAELAQTGPLPL